MNADLSPICGTPLYEGENACYEERMQVIPTGLQAPVPPETAARRKRLTRLGCTRLAVLIILIFGMQACQSGDEIKSSFTPVSTASATPNIRATNAEGTRLASTATAALVLSQTAQASATAGALAATATFQQAMITATKATLLTQIAETERAQVELEQAVLTICSGTGVPAAAPYTDQRAFHPILISPDQYPYPNEARPENLNQLELIACIEEAHTPVAGFPYTNFETGQVLLCHEDLIQLFITVHAAQTGEAIYTTSLEGEYPYNLCSPFETFPPGQTEIHKVGPPPDPALVWEAIKDLVFLELK